MPQATPVGPSRPMNNTGDGPKQFNDWHHLKHLLSPDQEGHLDPAVSLSVLDTGPLSPMKKLSALRCRSGRLGLSEPFRFGIVIFERANIVFRTPQIYCRPAALEPRHRDIQWQMPDNGTDSAAVFSNRATEVPHLFSYLPYVRPSCPRVRCSATAKQTVSPEYVQAVPSSSIPATFQFRTGHAIPQKILHDTICLIAVRRV